MDRRPAENAKQMNALQSVALVDFPARMPPFP